MPARAAALWEGIRHTVTAAPMAMLVADRHGRLRLLNDAACELLGGDRDSLEGRPVEDFVPAAARAQHGGWRAAYHTDPTRRPMGRGRDLLLHPLRGAPVPVEVGLNPMAVGDEDFVLCTVLDLRERQRAEAARRRLEQEASEANRLRSLQLLAGGVAQDFNGLLVSILGHASLLNAETPPESEAAEWIADIESAAQRAAALSKQILAFSGGGRFVVEPTDVPTALRSLAPFLRAILPREVAFRTYLDAQTPPLPVDRGQLRQMITNLVTNAAAALPPGTGTIDLSVHLAETAPEAAPSDPQTVGRGAAIAAPAVVIEVRDDGAGIDADVLPRVFEPFFSTRRDGHGMGLPAVLGVVLGHRGRVELTSRPGHGTTVRLWLPVEAPAAATP